MAYTGNVFAVPATATDKYFLLAWDYVDSFNKKFHESIYLDPLTTNLEISIFFGRLQLLTNAAIENVTLTAAITYKNIASAVGLGSGSPASYDTNAEIQLVELSRPNPLKSGNVINLNFPIPSYDLTKVRVAVGNPTLNVVDTDVAGVINFLKLRAGFRYSGDRLIYYGGWTYGGGGSGNTGDGSEIDTNAVVGFTV